MENIFIPIAEILGKAGADAGLTIDITPGEGKELNVRISLRGENTQHRDPVEIVVKGDPSTLEKTFITDAMPVFKTSIQDQITFEAGNSSGDAMSSDEQLKVLTELWNQGKALRAQGRWSEAANAFRIAYHYCLNDAQRDKAQRLLADSETKAAQAAGK